MEATLYISYDGMTDQLGQSQVLPYLIGLSKHGVQVVLISFEKKERFESNRIVVEEICHKAGIIWHPLMYTKKPPILSTLWDVYQMKKLIWTLHKRYHFSLTHCRSHISAIGGAYLKRRGGVPFIFDMRGFYADERVDGNIWRLSNPLFKMVYRYFKTKEKEFLLDAAATVSLTLAGKMIINSWNGFQHVPIDVIPCCADQNHFNPSNVNMDNVEKWSQKLGINADDLVITYLGSLGTWYMADEMFMFFKRLLQSRPEAKFLLITPDSKDSLLEFSSRHNISIDSIIVQSAKRSEVPELLLLGSVSVFFIKPVFSKQASSPVKMGEILAMGIPVIANSGVGDVDHIINDTQCGILIKEFTIQEYDKAINQIESLRQMNKEIYQNASKKYYSLSDGVDRYWQIYKRIF